MNALQKTEYNILVEFDKLCKENGLQYFLAYGTAIGAVRHGGFIPWDDDMDVVMFRKDYEKLLEIPVVDFPKNLKLRTVYSEVQHPYLFAKLCDINTTYVEENIKDLAISHGVFIDIFPLDFVPQKPFARFWQRCYAEYIWLLTARYRASGRFGKCAAWILNLGCTDQKYVKKIRKFELAMCNKIKAADEIALLSYGGRASYAKIYFKAEWFKPIKIDFETGKFFIMEGYDEFLRVSYGNYMELPPEEERISMHYAAEINLDQPCKRVEKED